MCQLYIYNQPEEAYEAMRLYIVDEINVKYTFIISVRMRRT